MRIYETSVGELKRKNMKADNNIVLGEEGRGRSQVIIPVSGAGNHVRFKHTGSGVICFATNEADNDRRDRRCAVIIRSSGGYRRGKLYKPQYDTTPELITPIAVGHGAWGQAGGVGGWQDVLAILEPGALYWLKDKYDAKSYFIYDGTITLETEPEHLARLALEEVAQGGGEWL